MKRRTKKYNIFFFFCHESSLKNNFQPRYFRNIVNDDNNCVGTLPRDVNRILRNRKI